MLAFSAARWAAMGFNRIADRAFDARNPRTRNRELPRGALTLGAGLGLGARGRRCSSCSPPALLNPLCLLLSPVALAWVLIYSLTKRFTWWPHLWLGLSLAIAPVGGYLAVTGRWSAPVAAARRRAAVATWVAGFDIFYALPDEGFDRGEGLRSAVVRLGEPRAILLAKLLHGITIPALALFGYGHGLRRSGTSPAWSRRRRSWPTSTSLVRPGDLSRLDAAFFTMNGVMSVTVFGFALRRPRLRATDSGERGASRSSSRSPAPRARRTACGCSRCWRGTGCRSG